MLVVAAAAVARIVIAALVIDWYTKRKNTSRSEPCKVCRFVNSDEESKDFHRFRSFLATCKLSSVSMCICGWSRS